MAYEIFTDSSANLTNELIDKYKVSVISLVFVSEGKEYVSYSKKEAVDLQPFYAMLRAKQTVTTSALNQNTAVAAFEPSLKEGKDIIYIGFSSALSATYISAEAALEELKKKYPERKIYASNSLAASLGQGLLVLYAAKMREQGKTIDEVFKWQEENKLKLCHYFTVDDLYYLFRGGRVKASKYLLANIINLKPIMHMDDFGRLIPLQKVIGRKKSISVLAEKVIENIVDADGQTIAISHGDCLDDALLLKQKILSSISVKDVIIHYVDPVIGVHSGPGTLAVFFLGDKR